MTQKDIVVVEEGIKLLLYVLIVGLKKDIRLSNLYNRKTIGCKCGDGNSYISKYIFNLLKQLNLDFDMEVKYDWNKYYNPLKNGYSQASIDYVVNLDNKRKIPIEADGEFHRTDNKLNGLTKEQIKYIDEQRDINCIKYLKEKTIRISNEGDIKENILDSELNTIFDLENINWNKCDEFASKNIVKEVCEMFNNGNDLKHICEVFKLSNNTIRTYLHKGNKLNWCNYAPKTGKKKISVYKNGELIGIFQSINYFSKHSIDIIGFRIENKNISRRLDSKNKLYGKLYKGVYEFKKEEF